MPTGSQRPTAVAMHLLAERLPRAGFMLPRGARPRVRVPGRGGVGAWRGLRAALSILCPRDHRPHVRSVLDISPPGPTPRSRSRATPAPLSPPNRAPLLRNRTPHRISAHRWRVAGALTASAERSPRRLTAWRTRASHDSAGRPLRLSAAPARSHNARSCCVAVCCEGRKSSTLKVRAPLAVVSARRH